MQELLSQYGKSIDVSAEVIMYVFGSQAIGCELKSSDVDVLVVGSLQITPEIFFDTVGDYLRENGCSNVVTIPTARVPLVKLKSGGVEFDLIYAAWRQENFDNFNILTFKIAEFEPQINGFRGCLDINKRSCGAQNFKTAFRALKIWSAGEKISVLN